MLIVWVISILLGVVDYASGKICSRITEKWQTETTKYRNVEHKGQISVFTTCIYRDFIVDGDDFISCKNGSLTKRLPTCKKATKACASLDPPLFGSKLCTVNAPTIGSVCSFQCMSTHYLRGSERRTCTVNLQWTGSIARCEKKPECPILPPLQNGTVIGCPPSKILRFNDTCCFKCNEGFKLEGPSHLTCSLAGKMVDNRGIVRFPRCYFDDSKGETQREHFKLTPWNPCVVNNGGCDQLCNSEAGVPTCECKEGFLLQIDGKNCKEIENFDKTPPNVESCFRHNGNCSHKCFQDSRGVWCSCSAGYKLLLDNKSCEDIDECSFGNFGCSHRCVNTIGAAHCMCPKGYKLEKNRKQCVDINECLRKNFGCSHRCRNTLGGARCECPAGYKLHVRNKKLCIDINECSNRNFECSHQCINTLGGAHCACPKGYALYEKQCVDVDECRDKQLNRCDQDCFNTEGSYNCSCHPGHVALGEFRCEPCRRNSYKGVDDVACIDCPAYSQTDGVGKTSSKDCICNPGFFGNLADNIPCQDINECTAHNFGCSDICSNTLGSAHCACLDGYELQEDRKTCSDIDECSLKNGGCDGICHNTIGNFTCSCLEGYISSNHDRYSCVDVDECEENHGGCRDKCINFQGGYHCACLEGYLHPDGKDCMAVHCPRVYVPHHSTLRCKNGLTSDKTDYKPGEVPDDAEFLVGTMCRVKCSKGYELNSDATIVCGNNGHWNATPPECEVLQCPPLIPPDNGDVYPSSCKEGPMAVKEKCVFTCLPGYRITGQEVITCKNKLTWDFKKQTVCVPETHPYISCPDDVSLELQSNESTIEIALNPPRTNMKQIRISPEWVFLDAMTPFPAGETEVTFSVKDDSSNKTVECSMSVFVVDKEPPVFYGCPETLHVTSSNIGTAVDWNEPTPFDNIGIASVFKSLEPNTTLPLGVHFVEYIVRDLAGNTAQCRFQINITSEEGCSDLADPENGEAHCMDWMFGKICQPSCHLNYTRSEEEPEYFACDESGTWTPSNFISPCFPECSEDEFWSPELEQCLGNYTVTTDI